MLHDLPDPAWTLQSALAPALQAMAGCGLVFDALVKPGHLPHLLTFCNRFPTLQVVIDHGAKPNIAANQWQPWADGLERIAVETSAFCELSGLMTEAGTGPVVGAVQRWGQHVLNTFGPERVLWGSDWPVLELAGSYATWWQETSTLLQRLSPENQAAVLGGTARRARYPRMAP